MLMFMLASSSFVILIPHEEDESKIEKYKYLLLEKDRSKQQKPEKDERSRIKLDVNNLLALSSLSRTLDCYSRSQSGPHISQHPGLQRLKKGG